jgi:hypothetical protein
MKHEKHDILPDSLFSPPQTQRKTVLSRNKSGDISSAGKPSWIPIIEADLGGDEEQVES